MRMIKVTLLVALSLLLFGCKQTTETPAETATMAEQPATDTAADAQSIQQLRDQWIAAAERDDAAAVTAFYTEDAVVTPADSAAAAAGAQAIQALFARDFPMATGLQVRSTELEVSGDLAYDFGEFSQRITPPKGKAMNVNGRYLVVLKRADGGWKIDKHMSFVIPPPAPARR